MNKQGKSKNNIALILGAWVLLSGGSVFAAAAQLTVTNIFATGQPATAASMNQNFSDVETAVNTLSTTVDGWVGVAGPAGPQGVQGPAGVAGPQGVQGLTGAAGPQGVQGLTGAAGASCALTECRLPGQSTLACGGVSIVVPCNLDNILEFQSTVTSVIDQGGLPANVVNGDIVSFSISMPLTSASVDSPIGTCPNSDCTIASWVFPQTSALLSYSSGYSQFILVDRIEISEGGTTPSAGEDNVIFYSAGVKIIEVIDLSGTLMATPMASDTLLGWMGTITTPTSFWLSRYYGSWGSWGTYHYDYTQSSPLHRTRVTFTP